MPNKKVYDYDVDAVRAKVLAQLKKQKRQASVADLIAATGLPQYQVTTELAAIADEYSASLSVTDKGEILYSFPRGFHSRYRGFAVGLKNFFKATKKVVKAVAQAVFKVWIMVMLIGYFVFFIALAILALIASIAMQRRGNSDGDGGGDSGGSMGGAFLIGNLFDVIIRMWFYNAILTAGDDRYQRRRDREQPKHPIHKAVFSFVFGDGDPNADWDSIEKKAVVSFLRNNKGLISMPEFMALTGLAPIDAGPRMNQYLYEFEGEPCVSEAGTIYYSFVNLLKTEYTSNLKTQASIPVKKLRVFSQNPQKLNGWFIFFNFVNAGFGAYFTYMSNTFVNTPTTKIESFGDFLFFFTASLFHNIGLADIDANNYSFIMIALGFVPLVFSVFFFLIPLVRNNLLKAENEKIKRNNLHKLAYYQVLQHPDNVEAKTVSMRATSEEMAPKNLAASTEAILKNLAASMEGEPKGNTGYAYPLIAETQAEIARARTQVREADHGTGKVIFDSDERIKEK